jgi:hypothetical protein
VFGAARPGVDGMSRLSGRTAVVTGGAKLRQGMIDATGAGPLRHTGRSGRRGGLPRVRRRVVGPDGTGTLDMRAVVETDDGALIFLHYQGRVDLSAGPGAPLYAAPLYAAPLFETRRPLPLAQPRAGRREGQSGRHDADL